MQIQIGGLLPFTTIDYPGKLAAVIFLVGCPLNCAYCSNRHLLEIRQGEYDPEKIIDWLSGRKGKLQAVVLSGGEALMQDEAVLDYIRRIKNLGFLVGIHTNGLYPNVLRSALEFVSWVGLDIKADEANYDTLTGSKGAYDYVSKSLDVLLKSGRDFECRTTADPRFVSKESLLDIARNLSVRGVRNFAVQKYIPHFENDSAKTTETERMQFFVDKEFKNEIDSLFLKVVWRE